MKKLVKVSFVVLGLLPLFFIAGCEEEESSIPKNADVMQQSEVSGNWELHVHSGSYRSHEVLPGTPGIGIISTPPRGSAGRVVGFVSGVVPSDHAVAMYIHVPYQGWWIKPRFNTVILIQKDGTWSANMATDGNDENADTVAAYLLPRDMPVPSALGSKYLPSLNFPRDVVSR